MKLHTVFITHNRLELTKRTIESYLETVTVPWTASVIDNGSTDGTEEWFFEKFNDEPIGFTALGENRYPGYAANLGWSFGLVWQAGGVNPPPTHLHRSDNDQEYLPGWCDEIQHIFGAKKVGQVGLRTDAQECYERSNTGGNCVIRRELWDKGLRYDERTWPQIRAEVGDGYSEDSFFSTQVNKMGYTWTRVKRECIRNLASGDWGDPYYQESYGVRGIRPHPDDPTLTDELREKLL